jgi:hypothetical protein
MLIKPKPWIQIENNGFNWIELSENMSSGLPKDCTVSLWIYRPNECKPTNIEA